MAAEEILRAATSVLVIDWPSRDVPDTLARAGYQVVVHGGPAPDDYSSYTAEEGEVVVRRTGEPPERAELVYSHRPLDELPEIVEMAQQVGATAVWTQSGLNAAGGHDPTGCWRPEAESQQGRAAVEAAGMTYIDDLYLPDVVRGLGIPTS
ncbi:MAG: CoA-binding protein [Acidimicrobiales bacterium]